MVGEEVLERAQAWCAADPDPKTRAEVRALIAARDVGRLAPMFAHRVAFGTAGLRAAVGPGPAHLNCLVVRQTAFGLGTYAQRALGEALGRGVVVGFDGRTDSARFADEAAGTLLAMGVAVWRAPAPTPTPLIGFAVARMGFALGMVITASHNPPADNGIKMYWVDGVQLVPPHDRGVAAAILEGVARHLAPPFAPPRGARALDPRVEAAYLAAIQPPDRARPARGAPELKIAYSPLHGVGRRAVERALALAGLPAPRVVAAQAEPDGAFPTLVSPNPEDPRSMREVVALAAREGADLALATDPDADRLGAAAPWRGGWRQLTGDELGALLADALLAPHAAGALVVTSLVSGPLAGRIARARGATLVTTPTGFKWLAQAMRRGRERGLTPTLAYEEALGFAVGEAVWDKDGVGALLALVAAARAWKAAGQTVWDRLLCLAAQHGVVGTCQITRAVAAAPEEARRGPAPDAIAGRPVLAHRDLATTPWEAPEIGVRYPPADVRIFELGPAQNEPAGETSTARVIVRPSGTEPKVKCYYTVAMGAPTAPVVDIVARADRLQAALAHLAACHQRDT